MNEDLSEESAKVVARSLGKLIAELRHQCGWSLGTLAEKSGRHRTYLGLVERGQRHLSVASAYRLAEALEISLSELIGMVESEVSGSSGAVRYEPRVVPADASRGVDTVREFTNQGAAWISKAIEATYRTLDRIDEQLINTDSPPLAEIVELANLSTILGNLLRSALAQASNGRYVSNEPHTYPDLVSPSGGGDGLEIKIALETNKPKGHLPKPGPHLTCRYVLADRAGNFTRSKRGNVVWIWEVRLGTLSVEDFVLSNTASDSGKTAVIKTHALDRLACVYFDGRFLPYAKPRLGHD